MQKGEKMIGGFITVKDAAEKWNISPRTVQILCSEGKIEGAAKFGKVWAIPADAERPKDNRLTSCRYINWRKRREQNSNTTKNCCKKGENYD